MPNHESDKVFSGSIPEVYETFLVPLIFQEFADDMAARVALEPALQVLELAAGTGVVTRAMVDRLSPQTRVTATDLNQGMLDFAAKVRSDPSVSWKQGDAHELPFEDGTFDIVACQFGAMFFNRRADAFAEARRVLKGYGRMIFSVWDSIEHNEFADVVTQALAALFPHDPPQFMQRTPHGYSNFDEISADLRQAGFVGTPTFETLTRISTSPSPMEVAVAYCQGTPLRNEIEFRDSESLQFATATAADALSARFGKAGLKGKIQGHVVSIRA